jgi:hypothetical protein
MAESRSEVPADRYYRPPTGVVPAPLKKLAVYSRFEERKLAESFGWPVLPPMCRLAGTTTPAPALYRTWCCCSLYASSEEVEGGR